MNTINPNSGTTAAASPLPVRSGGPPAPTGEKKLTIAELKKAAMGKWHHIFEALAPTLAEALAYALTTLRALVTEETTAIAYLSTTTRLAEAFAIHVVSWALA